MDITTNKSTGAYLRRRERRLTKKSMKTSDGNKLIIRAKRSYKESNRIFNA